MRASNTKALAVISVAVLITVSLIGIRSLDPTQRISVPVVLGTSGLIDGYHVGYAPGLQARWTVESFWLSSYGTLRLELRNEYVSEEFANFAHQTNFIGSGILLQVQATYVYPSFGDFSHYPLTPIINKFCNGVGPRTCVSSVSATFSLPGRIEAQELAYLEVQISWVRVFRSSTGSFYFQWLQSGTTNTAGADEVRNNLGGSFLVYTPISEPETSTVPLDGFDYVGWLKASLGYLV